MKNIPRFLALQVAVFLMASFDVANCQPKNRVSAHTGAHTNKVAIHSVADLRRLLSLGIDTNGITDVLGKPQYKENPPQGKTIWMYNLSPFPADDEMKGKYVVGVYMKITNGCLKYWTCQYADPSTFAQQHSIQSNNHPTRDDSTSFKLFVVDTNTFTVGKPIDDEQLSKLASGVPHLTISYLKDATWRTWGDHKWRIDVWPEPDDAAKLKSLTQTNISKTMLLVVGHQLVFAATIRSPLTSGLVFNGSGQAELERIKSDLSNLISRSK